MNSARSFLWAVMLTVSTVLYGGEAVELFNMDAMRDASTLNVEVIKDWHVVEGNPATRQKLIELTVGPATPEQDYRVRVQFAVPLEGKAKGFHLTSGVSEKAMMIRGPDADLIRAGVGVVKTHINILDAEFRKPRDELFYKTLDPQYRNFWIWPATFMRSITAAYAEDAYFENGKILVSGTSKVGETSAITLINDQRVTAAFGSVCPLYASPLRLSDPVAVSSLAAYEQTAAEKKAGGRKMSIGLAGGDMKSGAMAAGYSAKDLQDFAENLADRLFISRNVEMLKARGAAFLFQPGTHDTISYDGIWGGMNAPDVPVYNGANSGHGKMRHPGNVKQANKAAFILNHFLGGNDEMLEPPEMSAKVVGDKLEVVVRFKPGSQESNGRIFWMFDRGPDGSSAYREELIPDENWKEMAYDEARKSWTAEIELDANARRIDVFSNHQKTLSIEGRDYITAISSPYTRVKLPTR